MSLLSHPIFRAWECFWFAEGDPRNLAAARIIAAVTGLWMLLSRDLPAISGLPAVFWSSVPVETRYRYLLFPGHESVERMIEVLAIAALGGALLGIVPRISCFVGGILLYHLAPLQAIMSGPDATVYGFTTTVLALLTLSLAPCGRSWSLTSRYFGSSREVPKWTYHWPVRMIQVFLASAYVFSGYGKVLVFMRYLHHGAMWAASEDMRNWMMIFNSGSDAHLFSVWGLTLASNPVLFRFVWISIITGELAFPLALFSRPARKLLVPAAFFFHLAVLLTMNIFIAACPFLLVFADWSAIADRVGRGKTFPKGLWNRQSPQLGAPGEQETCNVINQLRTT